MMEHDMETMRYCVAAYLEHLRQADDRRAALRESLARLESSLDLGAIRYSDAPTGGDGDRMASGVAQLLELRAEWMALEVALAREYGEAMQFCYATEERRMCWDHWAVGITWTAVALRAYCDRKTVHRRKDKGVEDIYGWMPEEWRRILPNAQPWG